VKQDSVHNLSDNECGCGTVCDSGCLRHAGRNGVRPGVLFITGVAVVIAGLILPVAPCVLDVLVVLSICLTAALLIIAFSARQVPEVRSFPLLIVVVTALRMGLAISSSKLIFLRGDAGTVVSLLGGFVTGEHYVASIFVFFIAAIAVFGTICKAVSYVVRAGGEFNSDIAAFEANGSADALRFGFISEQECEQLRSKAAEAGGFYAAMGTAGRFVLCGAVVELVVLIFTFVGSLMAGAVVRPAGSALTAQAYVRAALGAWMVIQLSSLLTILSSKRLVQKSRLAFCDEVEFEEPGERRIEVTAREVQASETSQEELPAEFVEVPDSRAITVVNKTSCVEARCSANEQATENEQSIDAGIDECGYDCEDYDWLAGLIEEESGEEVRTILMGATEVSELPVTIPVNVAVRLAQNGRRCLLVDLDGERDAIAKVFELEPGVEGGQGRRVMRTCIENLWVLPAGNLCTGQVKISHSKLKKLIMALLGRFERVIIYAPNMESVGGCEAIYDFIEAALLFGEPGRSRRFEELLISRGCKVHRPSEALAGAV